MRGHLITPPPLRINQVTLEQVVGVYNLHGKLGGDVDYEPQPKGPVPLFTHVIQDEPP